MEAKPQKEKRTKSKLLSRIQDGVLGGLVLLTLISMMFTLYFTRGSNADFTEKTMFGRRPLLVWDTRMEPAIRYGSLLWVDADVDTEFEPGQYVVLWEEDRFVCRVVDLVFPDEIYTRGMNEVRGDAGVPKDQIVGTVAQSRTAIWNVVSFATGRIRTPAGEPNYPGIVLLVLLVLVFYALIIVAFQFFIHRAKQQEEQYAPENESAFPGEFGWDTGGLLEDAQAMADQLRDEFFWEDAPLAEEASVWKSEEALPLQEEAVPGEPAFIAALTDAEFEQMLAELEADL